MNGDSYFQLVALTEAPDARMRRLPHSQWQSADHHVANLLELLDLFETSYCNMDVCIERLSRLSRSDIDRYDNALCAIDARMERHRFGICRNALLDGLEDLEQVERRPRIAARIDRHKQALYRVSYEIDLDLLQAHLIEFVQAQGIMESSLPSPGMAILQSVPRAEPYRCDAGTGSRSIYLLRENAATTSLLDRWTVECAATECFDPHARSHASSFRNASHISNDARIFSGPLIGDLRKSRSASGYRKECGSFGNDVIGTTLEAIVDDFDWAVLHWSNIGTYAAIAWASNNPEQARRFERHLDPVAADCLISAYVDIDALPIYATGLQFFEEEDFGEAALVAARSDGHMPWLVALYNEQTAHWWRKASAPLKACALRRFTSFASDNMVVAYRGEDITAYRELWSHLDRDDNVAIAAVSGVRDPNAMLQAAEHYYASADSDWLRQMAGKSGWAYSHIWGGGSDEHVALFWSSEAQTTRIVLDYVKNRHRRVAPGYW